MYKPVATFLPASIDACASWRMFYPKMYIPGARFLFTEGSVPLDDVAEADVCVLQRMMMKTNLLFMQTARKLELKIIYDLDDNLWTLPKHNPSKQFFEHDRVREGMEICASHADVLTVSTSTLAKVVRNNMGHLRNVETGKEIPVMVCENRVPLDLFEKQEGIDYEHDGIVIGWGGSNTHAGDLAPIWPILNDILNDFPETRLELVGHSAPGPLAEHPRVRQRPWIPVGEYPARLCTWNWDIELAPLEMHKFNMSKSSIRMQSAGAQHRPCLATSITPYDEFVERGSSELKWLLCSFDGQWDRKLRELVRNASLRKSLGDAMYDNVVQNYSIELSAAEWEAAIQKAFEA